MGEIVNLRRVRKQAARAKQDTEAAENRVKFGRTKGEKQAEAAQRKLLADRLEGHALTKRETT